MHLRKWDALVLPRWSLLLIVAPVLLYFMGDFLYSLYSWKAVVPAPLPSAPGWAYQEMVGRSLVLTTVLAVVSIAFLAVGLFAADAARLFGPAARKVLLFGAGTLFVLLIASFSQTFVERKQTRMEDYVGRCFYPTAMIVPSAIEEGIVDFRASPEVNRKLLKRLHDAWTIDTFGHPALCTKRPLPYSEKPKLARDLRDWIKTIQVAMLIGVPTLMLGAISCVARPLPHLPLATRTKLHALQRQRLQRYLYGAALLLTTGMFFMMAWLRWPMFVFATSKDAEPYLLLVNAITLYFGVNYSLVIASYYIPVTLILRRREMSIPDEPVDPAEAAANPAKPLRTFGLDMATKLLTILAPAIASGLPALFDLASSVGSP